MRKLNLFIVLGISAFLFFSHSAFAVVVLQPGQVANIGGETVVCGGNSAPQQSWTCSCFRPNGSNVGTVSVYASSQQDAVTQSTPSCQRTFQDYSLQAVAYGCFVLNSYGG